MKVKMELDHVFSSSLNFDADVRELERTGFKVGLSRVHDGQGTRNVNFYFDNAYFEILTLNDKTEIQSNTVESLGLWERLNWRESGACPFGFALRPGRLENKESGGLETWEYHAPFLKGGAGIPIVTLPRAVQEPLAFIIPWGAPPAEYPQEQSVQLEHLGKRHVLTGVTLHLPSGVHLSQNLEMIRDAGIVKFAVGADYFLEIELNGSIAQVEVDYRPNIPLAIRW